MKVKVFGAGSIGNHMAQASRRMGWSVSVVDTDPRALERMKTDIYPKRYGAWDPAIEVYQAGKDPKGGFDIIVVGTPPDTHMSIAAAAIEEKPRLLHIEKPLCPPTLSGVDDFVQLTKEYPEVLVTVGYDHAVSEGIEAVVGMVQKEMFGKIITVDVEFREHWRGIFAAHPWLAGPWETYLGYWKRGGGASGENSHALHLWQHFAEILGWGKISESKSMLSMREEKGAEHDIIAAFLLRTEKGGVGRVIQDVITYPVRKWAKLQGEKGFIEWHCGGAPEGDLIRYQIDGEVLIEKIFPKKRPDDFYREVQHYDKLLRGEIKPEDSPLSFERGLAIMRILQSAHYG
ncbi:hypothetical protein A2935_01605 [Candidatus Wolfebacteria bacterium RIFCSPLOWO2_01_FULL_47_17b]|uniref:Gfo/Idh/MocA-like oxidoreductase N-terminal domain-containing protein n=1 Tax=Candidatus Wolfebacteria bacterium RIFCSPLOWO2_01_FULL_47_17b TaxID=1802558 RepID=A0A1F8E012_9BACT|nr:MAG: hypothetical protein A2935_01605 [Candidatus Wolfebacteria bacterium RIFCSPLOWO2_01_FULL_47_17b]